MILKLKIFIYSVFVKKIRLWVLINLNSLVKLQLKKNSSIPIIIINFNQLFYLQKLVNFLVARKFENIIIIDNKSTYEPLLHYYRQLPENVTVEYMERNYGHMVFFNNIGLLEKYGKGFYVVTDADILPNENLPEDFLKKMLKILLAEFNNISKVGFALKTNDIPDAYPFREQVINWEKKFWQIPYPNSIETYYAKIDTTFALYKPYYPQIFNDPDFLKGIRIAGDFTARHGGWYIDPMNMTDEQKYYQNTSSNASSWLIKENGQLDAKHSQKYSSKKQ